MNIFSKHVLAITALAVALGGGVISDLDPAQGLEKRGKDKYIVVMGRGDLPTMDPSVKYDAPTRTFYRAVYDTLLKYEGTPPEVKPWLATSWKVSKDGLVYTFNLAKNVKFHNGDPLTAEAVRWSFERTLTMKQGPSWTLADFLKAENVKALDDHTVQMTLDRPYAAFPSFLPWWFIMNPKTVLANKVDGEYGSNGDYGTKWLTTHEAGSGPFTLEREQVGRLWELKRNPNYWKPFKGELTGVILKLVRENQVMRSALEKGEADIVLELSADEFDVIKKLPGVETSTAPALTAFGLKYNTTSKYLSDVNVRKAVAYAYDYDSFVKIFNGRAILQTSPFNDSIKGKINVETMPRQDLAKAKEYLAKSKWPNGGFKLEFVYVVGFEAERQMGLVLIDALKPLNIDIELAPLTWTNMLKRGSTAETSPDLMAVFVTPLSNDPDAVAYQYHPESFGRYWGSHWFKDDALIALIEKGRKLIDWEERKPIYEEIQRKLVDAQPEIFGMMRARMIMYRDWVGGFEYTPVYMTTELDLFPLHIKK